MAVRGIGQADDSPVSKSAMLVCTACAVVSKDPVYARTFHDPYAELFATAISADAGGVLAGLDDAEARAAFIADWEQDLDGLITHVVYRKRWIGDHVAAALADGMGQLVIFGAGCDTLSMRLKDRLGGTPVFEIDRPEVIEFRRAVLADSTDVAANARLVPVDFERDDVAEGLAAAGFDSNLPTVFVAEAVMEYLTDSEVDRLFAFVRGQAPAGSRYLFTFLAREIYEGSDLDDVVAELKQGGEVLKFGLPPDRIDDFLASRGFRKLDFATPDWFRDVFIPPVGAPVGIIPGFHFVAAETVA